MPPNRNPSPAALAVRPTSSPPPASPLSASSGSLSPDTNGGGSDAATSPSPPPPWAAARPRRTTPSSSSARRLAAARPRAASLASSHRATYPFEPTLAGSGNPFVEAWAALQHASDRVVRLFRSLSPARRALAVAALVLVAAAGLALLTLGGRALAALGPLAKSWRDLPFGWTLVFLLVFVTGFPPVIGYSSAVTTAGFVYGFPLGWPIAAAGTVAGSAAAFFASRGAFAGYVQRLVGRDRRFVALAQVLRRDGLGVLTLIRFCPLPYSLSNGFLATIPSISPWAFVAGTALSTPKLLVHVFIGSRLALLAEQGDAMTPRDRAINFLSMFVFGSLGLVVGLVIYRRTMARAAELALEEGEAGIIAAAADGGAAVGEYADESAGEEEEGGAEGRLLRESGADPDAAALMDEDDISLWETDPVAGGYRDSWDEEEGTAQEGQRKGVE